MIRHSMSTVVMIKDSSGPRVMGTHTQSRNLPKPLILPSPGVTFLVFHPGKASLAGLQQKQCKVCAVCPHCNSVSALSLLGRAPRRGSSCQGPSLTLPHPLSPSLIPALPVAGPTPGEQAATSSRVAFQSYHSDE